MSVESAEKHYFGFTVKVIIHYLRNTGSPWIRRYWDGMESKRSVLYSHTNLHSLPVLCSSGSGRGTWSYATARRPYIPEANFSLSPTPFGHARTKTAEPKSRYRCLPSLYRTKVLSPTTPI